LRVPAGPFALVVGTVEPRKNHRVVLDAMERLWAEGAEVELVVVGRHGWKADDVAARLEATEGTRLTWWDSVTDAQLDDLSRKAKVVIVASRAEGYGLPVVEALQRGAVVLSSSGGALAEVGGPHVETFDPDDPGELAALVRRHLDDPGHHDERRRIAAAFVPQTWEQCARRVAAVLRDVASGDTTSS
jgi:glycosyltransferase involved in cell wall biosynthesis